MCLDAEELADNLWYHFKLLNKNVYQHQIKLKDGTQIENREIISGYQDLSVADLFGSLCKNRLNEYGAYEDQVFRVVDITKIHTIKKTGFD